MSIKINFQFFYRVFPRFFLTFTSCKILLYSNVSSKISDVSPQFIKIFSQLLIIRSYTSRGSLNMYAYANRRSLKIYAYTSRRSLKVRVRPLKTVAEPPNPRGVNPIPLARLRVYCTLVAAANPGPADRRTRNSWEGSGKILEFVFFFFKISLILSTLKDILKKMCTKNRNKGSLGAVFRELFPAPRRRNPSNHNYDVTRRTVSYASFHSPLAK